MSARVWERRRAGQWGERPSYERWLPQHPGVDSPGVELMLYGSYFTEKVWERPVVRARRLRAERHARRQRRRHVPRFHTAPAWRFVTHTSITPSPAVEDFLRARVGLDPAPWSRPDADPLADMQAVYRQAELDYHRSLGAMHKTEAVLDEVEIRGSEPLGVWLDEMNGMGKPDA